MCPEWTFEDWLAALDDLPNWLIREPRKRRIQSGDLDLGCLRSATFAPNQRDSSAQWQSKQTNANVAFELSRRRQIPPFAAVYTREPSGVRQRSVGGDPLRKNAPTASGDAGFAAHLSHLASLSPGLRSRRPFTSRWVCREVGVSLASQSEAL